VTAISDLSNPLPPIRRPDERPGGPGANHPGRRPSGKGEEDARQCRLQASPLGALGVILLLCVVAYAIPRTSVLGALLTGYLGGAVATHVRVGNPLFSHTLFPIYFAFFVWGGLVLRDARLRALLPGRTSH